MLKPKTLALTAVSLCVMVAGCTSPGVSPSRLLVTVSPEAPAGGGADPTTAASSGMTWADGEPLEIVDRDLASAREAVEGTDYEALFTTPARIGDRTLAPLALAADGQLLAGLSVDGLDEDRHLVGQAVMGLYDGSGFRPFDASAPAQSGELPRQAYAGSFLGDVPVWVETASTDLYELDWRIFAHEGPGAPSTVAHSGQFSDAPLPIRGEETAPRTAHGRIYFGTPVPDAGPDADASGDARYRTDVVSTKVDGTDRRVERAGAGIPAPADGAVLVVRTRLHDPALPEGRMGIEQVEATGRSTVVLESDTFHDREVASMVTDGRHIAFVEVHLTDRPSLVVVDTRERSAFRVRAATTTDPTMALCGSTLTFNLAAGDAISDDSQYVLDLATHDLAAVPVARSYPGALCAGDLVAWKQLADGPDARATVTVTRWKARSARP